MSNLKWDYSLYLATDRSYIGNKDLTGCVIEAIEGGVTMVQLREKTASSRDFYHLALALKEVTTSYHIPLIINDRMDIALAVDADGLHLGQDDLPIKAARRFLGPDKVLGISVGNVQEAVLAQEEGADYLGAGAMFATGTKPDAELVSLEELKKIKESVIIPVVAIGGIKKENAAQVMLSGIDGICVVSAILAAGDFRMAARELKETVSSLR